MTSGGHALTEHERACINKLGQVTRLLDLIVEDGPNRAADLIELVAHVHVLQSAVMAQAAARAYPNQLRRLGQSLGQPAMDLGDLDVEAERPKEQP